MNTAAARPWILASGTPIFAGPDDGTSVRVLLVALSPSPDSDSCTSCSAGRDWQGSPDVSWTGIFVARCGTGRVELTELSREVAAWSAIICGSDIVWVGWFGGAA